MVKFRKLRYFGYLDQKNVDDWLSTCRSLEVTVVKRRGSGRKTWGDDEDPS